METESGPQGVAVQRALAELAGRVPGLTYHEGARGHGSHPYVSGTVGDPPARLEILRSVRWHEDGIAIRLAAGPFGVWSKPVLPDVDHQEGGLTFLPDQRHPAPTGMLASEPEAQSALHDLWVGSRWTDEAGRTHDGLSLLVRPNAVVAHVHSHVVTADVVKTLVDHLPAMARSAHAHDDEWSRTDPLPPDQWVWPAIYILAVLLMGLLLYIGIR
jgi:hypothetical protein